MAIDLEAIKTRLAAATPGAWAVSNRCFIVAGLGDVIVSTQSHPYQKRMDEDLALIAHTPTDIDALLAEVKALRTENTALRTLVGEMAAAVKAGDVTCLHLVTRAQRATSRS